MIKQLMKSAFQRFGYSIQKIQSPDFGGDPFIDMRRFITTDSPVCFDVGANVGQTVQSIHAAFPGSVIHCFEPAPQTFAMLQQNCQAMHDISLWNRGVGSAAGTLTLRENSDGVRSSFLQPDVDCWGKVVRETAVEVLTLDEFASGMSINRIDLLKADTQGYELEVFKGAKRLMAEHRIGMVLCEINFSNMYEGQPSFSELLDYLLGNGFLLVGIYNPQYRRDLLGWADLLLVNRELYGRQVHGEPPQKN